MATALTPQTDVTSEKVRLLMENPRQQSQPAYRKENWLKTNIIFFFIIFYFIKSQTSDSFVNHFDGHFAYLKTLDFSFKPLLPILNLLLRKSGSMRTADSSLQSSIRKSEWFKRYCPDNINWNLNFHCWHVIYGSFSWKLDQRGCCFCDEIKIKINHYISDVMCLEK